MMPPIIPTTAMIMAAGLGKRMRPLTHDRPKPMIEVAGRTLIDRVLDRLAEVGVVRAVVNLHYMADILEAHLESRSAMPEVLFSDERSELLETGGGVKRALPLLGEEAFLVLNSDMIWTDGTENGAGNTENTLTRMAGAWRPEDMDALLLMVPTENAAHYAGRGDFEMDGHSRLTRRAKNRDAPCLYGGIQILHPRIFDGISETAFSTNLAWDRALANGRLFGIAHAGHWIHVGTPQAVKEAEDLLAT